TRSTRDWSSDVCSSDLRQPTHFPSGCLTARLPNSAKILRLLGDLPDRAMIGVELWAAGARLAPSLPLPSPTSRSRSGVPPPRARSEGRRGGRETGGGLR